MEEYFSDNQVAKYFKIIEQYLLSLSNRGTLQLKRKALKSIPEDAGVYCIFIDDNLCYVGETGCISKRLADLLDTRNHTLRRTIGERYFMNEIGYIKASSKIKYPIHIEEEIETWMNIHLKFSFIPMKIGRKEFEEWLQQSNPSAGFLNKRTKRK